MDNIKKDIIKKMINIALEETIEHKGLPKDENKKVSCKDFLSLVSQYTTSFSSKIETQKVLNESLNDKIEKFDNKTLKELLLELKVNEHNSFNNEKETKKRFSPK